MSSGCYIAVHLLHLLRLLQIQDSPPSGSFIMAREIILNPNVLLKRDLLALRRHHARLAEAADEDRPSEGAEASGMTIRLRFSDTEEDVILPPSLANALAAALAEVAEGHTVRLTAAPEELTTSAAAEVLNVSRPFLIKLLEQGKIPYRKVGTHRRIRYEDVLTYREKMYKDAEDALQALADQAQELGLGAWSGHRESSC